MGKPVVGEIVVLPFPQTDLRAGKRRPALVAAALQGEDMILCQITSRSHSDGFSVSLTNDDFERGQLAVDHAACFSKTRTLSVSAEINSRISE